MVPSPECRLPPLDSEFGREIANSIPRNFTEEYTIEISSDAYIFKGTKDMKESIVPIITAILPNVSEEVEEKLTTVIFYITESLTSEWWIDDSHLDPDNGDQVFEADNAAIKILSELVENYEHYDISLSTASELANALGALWKTDLELAETVYIEAGLAGCPDEAMNYVGKRLIEGHYSIDACDWAQASRGFHKAWREGAVAFYALVNGNIPSLFDPADDIYRDDGSYADGPEWQDITEVRVDRTDKVITFSLYVNDTFPTHETYWDGAIMILIDIDGDGEPVPSEGTIDFYGGNMDFGIFIPSPEFGEPPIFIEDLRLQGSGTPDTTGAQYSVEGNKIEVEVETEHVGAPEGRIGFVAAIRTGFTADLVEDRIPDKELAYEWPMIHVAILGDLNADNTVNIIDLTIVAVAFGSKPGDSKWNQIADMNNDEKINIIDITMVALEYGQTA